MSSTFAKAWKLLKGEIDQGKTSWGKVELKNLMFICLQRAALEKDDEEGLLGSDD